jgi:crotonobetainyl-CoA:carnitine CoA-transferase CaiB-like acyl-CoA transferase
LGGGPHNVGDAVDDLFTGMYATVAILAALRHAERTGEGQRVDMALLDTQVSMLANLGANYLVSGNVPGRAGNAHQNIVPYQVFETAPGARGRDFLILAVGNDSQFAKFCEAAGRPEIAADVRFSKNSDRVRNRAVLVPMLEDVMRQRTKAQWLEALEIARVPCGPINHLAEVFADVQVNERAMVDTWSHPLHEGLRLVASPMKLSGTPVRKDHPPPLLGQHTAEVLREVLGWDEPRVDAAKAQGVV